MNFIKHERDVQKGYDLFWSDEELPIDQSVITLGGGGRGGEGSQVVTKGRNVKKSVKSQPPFDVHRQYA